MSTVETPRRAPARRSQTRRAAGWLLSSHLYVAAWFWGIVVVLATLGLLVFGNQGTYDGAGLRLELAGSTSLVGIAVQAAMWFSFALAIALSLRQLEAHVAAGLTRRSFLRANLLVCAAVAVLYALVMVLLIWVESLVAQAAGWGPRTVTMVPYESTSNLLGLFVVYLLTFATAAAAGLVVGMAYYGLGGLRGTLSLVGLVPPVLLVMYLLGQSGDGSWLPAALEPVPARMAVCALVACGYAVVYVVQMRRVTV